MLKRLTCLTIILLLFIIAVNAQSQQSTPRPSVSSNPPQIQTSNEQQISNSDKRGTEQSPYFVKTINPPKTQSEIDLERKDREEKAAVDRSLVTYTRFLAIFTAILAFFTCVLAGVAVWQGIQMKKAVKIAGDTSIRQLRAYILAESVGISNVIGNSQPKAIVEFRNSGQTPAYEVHGSICIGLDKFPLTDIPWDKISPAMDCSKDTVSPGGKIHFPVKMENPLTVEEFSQLNDENCAIYVFGKLFYKDIFDKDRFTEFTFFYNKITTIPDRAAIYSKGNDAS